MWNKRKEEDFAPRPTVTPTPSPVSPEATRRENVAPVTPPAPAPRPAVAAEPEGTRGAAMVGKSVVLKGAIVSKEDLYIDGEVEGTVELPEHRLTIGPHGRVQAGVKAREIVVLGTINGNVEAADKIDIRKEARLVGDIKTSRISIEDGAYFKGSIDISRPGEPRKPAPAPLGREMGSPIASGPSNAGPMASPAPAAAPANSGPGVASALEQPKR